MASQRIDLATSQVDKAALIGQQLSDSCATTKAGFAAIRNACPSGAASTIQQLTASSRADVDSYCTQVQTFDVQIQPLPDSFQAAKSRFHQAAWPLLCILLLPLALVLLCCIVIFSVAACAKRGRASACCVSCLGPLMLAPTILIVTLAAALMLYAGTILGSFSADPNANALAFISDKAGRSSAVYQLSFFYITGEGEKPPLITELSDINAKLAEVQASMPEYMGLLASTCPGWSGAGNLTSALDRAHEAIEAGEHLISRENIFPYYEDIVALAVDITNGLGWMVLFQSIAGVLFLPCFVLAAHRYLALRSDWHLSGGLVFK